MYSLGNSLVILEKYLLHFCNIIFYSKSDDFTHFSHFCIQTDHFPFNPNRQSVTFLIRYFRVATPLPLHFFKIEWIL